MKACDMICTGYKNPHIPLLLPGGSVAKALLLKAALREY